MRLALVSVLLLASCSPAAADRAISPGRGEAFTCSVASITDGDTLRCRETDARGRQIRLRLAGINARERDGSCPNGRPCPAGSAEVATAELTRLAAGRVLSCIANGTTHGRIAAFCQRQGDGLDISCAMVASGTAARWDRHWQGHRC